jgi:hypothetical protein
MLETSGCGPFDFGFWILDLGLNNMDERNIRVRGSFGRRMVADFENQVLGYLNRPRPRTRPRSRNNIELSIASFTYPMNN